MGENIFICHSLNALLICELLIVFVQQGFCYMPEYVEMFHRPVKRPKNINYTKLVLHSTENPGSMKVSTLPQPLSVTAERKMIPLSSLKTADHGAIHIDKQDPNFPLESGRRGMQGPVFPQSKIVSMINRTLSEIAQRNSNDTLSMLHENPHDKRKEDINVSKHPPQLMTLANASTSTTKKWHEWEEEEEDTNATQKWERVKTTTKDQIPNESSDLKSTKGDETIKPPQEEQPDETTNQKEEETTEAKTEEINMPETEGTTNPKPEYTTLSKSEETTMQKKNEITTPKSEETTKPKADETTMPKAGETTKPKADETTKTKADETTKPKTDETTKPKADETLTLKADETTMPKVEGTIKSEKGQVRGQELYKTNNTNPLEIVKKSDVELKRCGCPITSTTVRPKKKPPHVPTRPCGCVPKPGETWDYYYDDSEDDGDHEKMTKRPHPGPRESELDESDEGCGCPTNNSIVPEKGLSNCVHSEKMVVGFRNVEPKRVNIEDFPYLVEINYQNNHRCGGTLLSTRVVLTAAHCCYKPGALSSRFFKMPIRFKTGELNVVMGSVDRDPLISDPNHERRGVLFVYPHEKYDPWASKSYAYDIGLMLLSHPVTLTKYIALVQLKPPNTPVPSNERCIVLGWGSSTKVLHSGCDMKEAKPLPASTMLLKIEMRYLANCEDNPPDEHICAMWKTKQACMGDSGSPLVCGGLQIALVGKACELFCPGFYYRLDRDWQLKWIGHTSPDLIHLSTRSMQVQDLGLTFCSNKFLLFVTLWTHIV